MYRPKISALSWKAPAPINTTQTSNEPSPPAVKPTPTPTLAPPPAFSSTTTSTPKHVFSGDTPTLLSFTQIAPPNLWGNGLKPQHNRLLSWQSPNVAKPPPLLPLPLALPPPPSTPAPAPTPTSAPPISRPALPPRTQVPPTPPAPLPISKPQPGMAWSEKYRPLTEADFFGNPKAVQQLKEWIIFRKRYPRTIESKMPLVALLQGPPGVGKTSLANLLLRDHGFQAVEVNASDERTRQQIYDRVKNAVTRKSLGKPAAIILDEMDGAVMGKDEEDNSGIAGLLQFLTECQEKRWPVIHPIIAICNDASSKDVRRLKQQCLVITFYPVWDSVMMKVVQRHSVKEGMILSPDQQKQFAEAAHGDFRKLCQLLQMASVGLKGKQSLSTQKTREFLDTSTNDEFNNMFNLTRSLLFKSKLSLEKACLLVAGDVSLTSLMIQENAPQLFASGPAHPTREDDMSEMADALSNSDIWDSIQWQSRTSGDYLAHAVRTLGHKYRTVGNAQQDVRFTSFFTQQQRQKQNLIALREQEEHSLRPEDQNHWLDPPVSLQK